MSESIIVFLFAIIVIKMIMHMRSMGKSITKTNAWKVKPELADRFLDVLANNDYKWMSGHVANEFCPLQDDVPLLFIEGARKRIYYTRYFSYPNNLEEEYNVTEITEELLKHMENEGVVRMRGDETWKH